jgi:hypothetical protein
MASGAGSEDAFLAKVKVQTVAAPEPRRQPRTSGSQTPELPAIPGLVEQVWESYQQGEYMILSAPPAFVERVRKELQAARRYILWQHRDDDPELDIRGLSKPEITVIDPDTLEDESPYAKYVKMIRKGEVGVLFKARPPELRGIRARRAAQEGVETRKSRAEYKRDWRAKQKKQREARAAGTVTEIRGGKGAKVAE